MKLIKDPWKMQRTQKTGKKSSAWLRRAETLWCFDGNPGSPAVPENRETKESGKGEGRGTLSKQQIKAIWAIAHRTGVKEEYLRSKVESAFGKNSIRALTKEEAGKLIEDLLGQGREEDDVRCGTAPKASSEGGTRAQMALIQALSRQAGWEEWRVERLAGKMYGVRHLSELKVKQASGLIEALKAIKHRDAA